MPVQWKARLLLWSIVNCYFGGFLRGGNSERKARGSRILSNTLEFAFGWSLENKVRRREFLTMCSTRFAHLIFGHFSPNNIWAVLFVRIKKYCGSISSVADPGCLFRILIFIQPDPDVGSRIPVQKQQQKRGVKKICFHTFLCNQNFTKLKIILVLKCWEKIWANFQRFIEFLPKKLSQSSQKYGFGIRDPRTGIRKNPIPDPGSRVKKAPDPGSGSATLSVSISFGSGPEDP